MTGPDATRPAPTGATAGHRTRSAASLAPRWVRTAGTALAAVVVLAAGLLQAADAAAPAVLVGASAVLATSAVLSLYRPRLAVAVALGGYLAAVAAEADPTLLQVAPALALLSFGLTARARSAAALGAALVVAAAGIALVAGDDALSVVAVLLVLLAALTTGFAIGRQRGYADEARARLEADVRAERAAAERRMAEERVRIAQDLHDAIAHTVTVVNLHANLALRSIDEDTAAAKAALDVIRGSSVEALAEMRRLVGVLRQHDDRPPPASRAAIDDLLSAVRRSGLDVVVEPGTDVFDRLPGSVLLLAYRTIQEGLTNVLRHSRARRVTVVVEPPPEFVLSIGDDGPARRPAAAAGVGLVGLRERASVHGGALDAGPDGPGFRVRLSVRTPPVEPAA